MTLVVKLGSSIVAADDGELRAPVLDSVCSQVAALEGSGERVVMVTSGAIARGIRLMGLPARPRAIDELQAASAVGQGDLFRAYEGRLAEHGTRAAQVLLTSSDFAARRTYVNAQRTLARLLEWQVVPVINENDTTATDEITFGDNDFLAAQVAILLGARLLVLLTNTAGLHTADPRLDPTAELVTEVSGAEDLDGMMIGDRTSAFGSGGMRSKAAAASMAAESGIETVICDGTEAGTLRGAVAGERLGTRFAPRPRRSGGFKLWLRHAKPAAGRIEIDAGAAEALRERGSSLLPVGITSVEGDFEMGAAVEVLHAGERIGKGIAECSASQLDEIKGMKMNELAEGLRERLGIESIDEAINRDRLILY